MRLQIDEFGTRNLGQSANDANRSWLVSESAIFRNVRASRILNVIIDEAK